MGFQCNKKKKDVKFSSPRPLIYNTLDKDAYKMLDKTLTIIGQSLDNHWTVQGQTHDRK